ncbi:site-specific integrase [Mycolicibacterium austroafricanum]|uniref:Tyrosine-type recombinase/integrase n=1 Tax=Mycolicibacterium austroafricanum TaxID=39687 RepID=A0ABT8HPD8_MYCAO|nr:tyrosine-type recombinase/integrase [Mycolicibacterium austroafricanum]MDN4522629.1 tyrosine-type recombinase/integrase [Mycolicibacterium austroafricanum]QRZ07011.1 site-specific integrase [Mycolicibacterium austroafricanum]QZT68497.1 site-specific integrase [Mycolicibacterium austroafricanum]
MATIEKYETDSGTTLYRVRYRTPDRRQTTKRGFTTKRDAQAWANQLEVDKRKGAYVAPAAGRVKLGQFAGEWLDSKHKLKPSTRARYQVALDTFIAAHAEVPLGDISRQLVREWVADLSTSHAPASVHKTIGVLRQVLAMAVRENRLVMNPVDGVELPSVTSVEQRFLTLEQLHALADAAGDHRALVYVLGTCGLRFGEAAELRWGRDVDLQKLQIRVTRSVALVDNRFMVGSPKNGKGRTVSLPAFVADLLTPGDADALVFPDSTGGYMRGTNVRRRWWADAVAAAKLFPRTVSGSDGRDTVLHEFKIHELRHTAASLAIQGGANIKSLQNMLGHESAALTLDRYGHLYGSDVEAVGVAINALLTRDCGQNVVTDAA